MTLIFWAEVALCVWSADPTVNTPVCTASNDQQYPQIISDGYGGAIIVWGDERNYPMGYDIYAQRLDSRGNVLWRVNGMPVCTSPDRRNIPQLISDDSGGAIIVWSDRRSGAWETYAQHLNSSGIPLWIADGVLVSTAGSSPQLISDNEGGAIIAFGGGNIYAQRLDSSGNVLWVANGVPVCMATNSQGGTQIIPDGSGGAIITWFDGRISGWDIYAQRVNSSGNVLWPVDGVPVCTAAHDQDSPQIITDGQGGAIIVWQDRRDETSYVIYAQRLDSSGNALWIANGVPVSPVTGLHMEPQLISDGSGGAVITWYGDKSGTDYNIYAQRVDSSGNILWAADGAPVCEATGLEEKPQLVSDGSGGVIITWQGSGVDIYAQRVDSSGNILWAANGVPVSTLPDYQWKPQLIFDGSGGVIICWEDRRLPSSQTAYDIYAQRVSQDGLLGELKELIVPWFNDTGSYSSFITVHNPAPETVTVSVTYAGPDGQDATPSPNTFTIGPARSLAGRPHQASGLGEETEEGPPRSLPNSLAEAPFGSAVFSSLMPFGYSLAGDTLRMGSIPVIGFFSGIAPAYSK